MLIEIQKRKCLRCGHEFPIGLGGFLFVMFPRCPKCGFRLTRKTGKVR